MEQLTTEQVQSPRSPEEGELAYSLLVISENETSSYPLPRSGQLLIGRSAGADIRIEHGSVSREHARLHLGPELLLEDLGGVNGTRLRGDKLTPGQAVRIAPDDVVDMGRVMLVIKHRRLEQRLRPLCSKELFELRVDEECERLTAAGSRFAVLGIHVTGALRPPAIEALLATELRHQDAFAERAPGHYELLLLDAGPDEAEERSTRLLAELRGRQLQVESRVTCAPRDGTTQNELLGRRPDPPPPSSHVAMAGFVVVDDAMRRVRRLLERVAQSELGVLLLGETGVGKELCAELLHVCSPRAGRTFLRLNCAALAENLLESELFGYERGAFTGAVMDKIGLLEAANGGTVLLDEVGDMPLSTQVKLLRVLESKEILRLGARQPRRVDVRIVSATNRDLHELTTRGLFREDLFYRLNGISVVVPPLRERPADVEALARHFLRKRAQELDLAEPAPRFSAESVAWLKARRWPGNVRELKNVIERALVLCDGAWVEPVHLDTEPPPRATIPSGDLRSEVHGLERQRIEDALRESGGNQRRAAELLGLSRGALLRRLELLGIARPRKG